MIFVPDMMHWSCEPSSQTTHLTKTSSRDEGLCKMAYRIYLIYVLRMRPQCVGQAVYYILYCGLRPQASA